MRNHRSLEKKKKCVGEIIVNLLILIEKAYHLAHSFILI